MRTRPSPRRAPVDLEHGAGDGPFGVAVGGGQQLLDAGDQFGHARAGDRRSEVDRVHQGLPGLRDQGPVQQVHTDPPLDTGLQQVVVMVRENVVGADPRDEAGLPRAESGDRPHRHDGRGQALGDGPQDTVVAGAPPVDLVDEDEGRDAQALEGPHQHAGLGLDALDGRDDEHGAVEHAEDALHLGDEVGVTWGVDEVDGHVVDREGDDGGLDGDAAPTLEGEGVGLRAAGVDAADLVDDSDRVQEPLGQAGLTGVDVGEDPEVEQVHEASCPLERGRFLPGWTWTQCA